MSRIPKVYIPHEERISLINLYIEILTTRNGIWKVTREGSLHTYLELGSGYRLSYKSGTWYHLGRCHGGASGQK